MINDKLDSKLPNMFYFCQCWSYIFVGEIEQLITIHTSYLSIKGLRNYKLCQ